MEAVGRKVTQCALLRHGVQNYWSIKDTGWFDIDPTKSILVGPNEAGKTAVMRALEHLAPGSAAKPFAPLRDFPSSEYHRIQEVNLIRRT